MHKKRLVGAQRFSSTEALSPFVSVIWGFVSETGLIVRVWLCWLWSMKCPKTEGKVTCSNMWSLLLLSSLMSMPSCFLFKLPFCFQHIRFIWFLTLRNPNMYWSRINLWVLINCHICMWNLTAKNYWRVHKLFWWSFRWHTLNGLEGHLRKAGHRGGFITWFNF